MKIPTQYLIRPFQPMYKNIMLKAEPLNYLTLRDTPRKHIRRLLALLWTRRGLGFSVHYIYMYCIQWDKRRWSKHKQLTLTNWQTVKVSARAGAKPRRHMCMYIDLVQWPSGVYNAISSTWTPLWPQNLIRIWVEGTCIWNSLDN